MHTGIILLSKGIGLMLSLKGESSMEADQRLDVVAGRLPLRVVELDPQTDPRWETLMKSLPTSVIFQHPAWLGVLEETYGYKPNHLACEDATGELRGVLPLFYRRGLRTGRMYASLFDSAKAGPLAYDDQARAALIQAAIERAGAEPGIQLQIRVRSNSLDGLVDSIIGVPIYESYELALPERLDLLRLNSSIKRAINKATRLGVQVRQAETEGELRAWYGLYLQTMRRLVVMPRPYRFFELAWQRLRPLGLLRLLLAEHVEAGQSGMVAGLLFLQWGQTISMPSLDGDGRIKLCGLTISSTGGRFRMHTLRACAAMISGMYPREIKALPSSKASGELKRG
jgi:hypothetical protein